MSAERPLLGIALMLGFCVLAPLADAVAKLIGDQIPLAQLVAVRFGIQALLVVPLFAIAPATLRIPRDLWLPILARCLLQIAGIAMIFYSLRYLPLADAIAIAYVMPFLVLLLGYLWLGETVGTLRLAACGVGFGGTLMVMQPSFTEVGWVAALPVGVAVIFALFMLVTRTIAQRVDAVALQAVTGLIGSVLILPLLAGANGTGQAELDPVLPAASLLWLMVAMGVIGTLSHLVLTGALRHAPTATLAPMQYLEIPVAAVLGWLMFQEFPNGLALAGIGVVIGAGLFIVWREHRQASAAPA